MTHSSCSASLYLSAALAASISPQHLQPLSLSLRLRVRSGLQQLSLHATAAVILLLGESCSYLLFLCRFCSFGWGCSVPPKDESDPRRVDLKVVTRRALQAMEKKSKGKQEGKVQNTKILPKGPTIEGKGKGKGNDNDNDEGMPKPAADLLESKPMQQQPNQLVHRQLAPAPSPSPSTRYMYSADCCGGEVMI